ncbi:hypothetical protein Tco_0650929 [Tanacetum coccineum]
MLTNDDLLTQILTRLPILCIRLFAAVSKQWLRIITSPLFIKHHNQITKVDPPVGLFVNHTRSLFKSDFVLLDPRLQSKKSAMDRSFTLGSTEEVDNIKILYRVHTDDFMTPLPKGWLIRSNVWSIVLGEREQDSFLVINLSRKVVQYNLISKTLHEIYDCGSNQLDDNHDDNDYDDDEELLQQF